MENRRLLLAGFVSVLILILWNAIFPPAPPVERDRPVDHPTTVGSQGDGSSLGGPARDDRGDPSGPGVADPTMESSTEALAEDTSMTLLDFGEEQVEAVSEEQSILETETFRAVFSNRGAQLLSYQLKKDLTAEGEPLELIRQRGTDPYPFSLVSEGGLSHRLNKALFEVRRETGSGGGPSLRYRYRGERGLAEKVFSAEPSGLLDAEITVAGDTQWSVLIGPGLRNLPAEELENRFVQRGVGYKSGSEIEILAPQKQEEDVILPAFGLHWITLEDNYFINALIPTSGVEGVVIRPVLQRKELDASKPRFLPQGAEVDDETVVESQMLLVEAAGERMEVQTYFGAKRYSVLADLPYGLQETVRWGALGFIAKPIYYGLEWIHREHIPNYGWAIVLITFLIKLILFPLTFKSQQSMTKMQELNPRMQAIRSKYRPKLKDRQGRPNVEAQQQMNAEIMALYKSAGVNPAAGCLPILLQLPIFFAFYKVLLTAVELRNADWIIWIKDLSSPDPIYILPVLMTLSSVLMQRIMPSAPDPMQRRIMQMMPIAFGVFALAFPSGLVLYWLTNNLLTIVQQMALMRLRKNDAPAAASTKG